MAEIANGAPLYDTKDRLGPFFKVVANKNNCVTLESPEGHKANLFVLEDDIIRVMVLPGGVQHVAKTWSIAPGQADVPFEGNDRLDISAFSCPSFELTEANSHLIVETHQIKLDIDLNGFICSWFMRKNGAWIRVAMDRQTKSYNFSLWDHRVYHYLSRTADEMYFGLGEKSGDANRLGNSYRMQNVDGAFYSAKSSDPLYKHIPFYITYNKAHKTFFGLFYDTHSDCTFDMGREISNYHGPYRYFAAEEGDLDFYFIAGDEVKDVVARYTWLTGIPMFPPKWSLGYSGSTMTYTDAPNAQERMGEFVEKCREHDILCESFHMSSGYTMINGKRYVFNWDTSRFPDAKKFLTDYKANGIRVVANIKPALLKDHPQYVQCREARVFIENGKGDALSVPFWGGEASYVDFTNPEGIKWWKEQFTKQLLAYGVTSAWNDNNEFEIMEAEAYAKGFDHKVRARGIKPLQTLLMLKSSYAAQCEFAPEKRAFSVSRAGVVGMHRYVQTWSGDNYTSWETLKYNIKMGLSLAMSGVFNTGHDVGGFLGPVPEPELFARWIQFGIFMPRFSIHSENSGALVTEPWMYPELTPFIRDMIKFRHQLQPYFYNLLWRAHTRYEPIVRPTYFNFANDARSFEENDDMMVGDFLLHPAVVEPGARLRKVHLPVGANWFDFWTGEYYTGGQDIDMAAPLSKPLLLAREGAIIAFNRAKPTFSSTEDKRTFLLFPHQQDGQTQHTIFEDDGESFDYRSGKSGEWQIDLSVKAGRVQVGVVFKGDLKFRQSEVALELPAQDTRPVTVAGAKVVREELCDGRRVLFLNF